MLFGTSTCFCVTPILYDITEELYLGKSLPNSKQKLLNFEVELDFDRIQNGRPTREEVENSIPTAKAVTASKNGYCIRTGIEIPFNSERPLSHQAFQSWSKFRNEEYPEKYCHYSGELSRAKSL